MKKKFSAIETILGFVVLLGGLLTYALGVHALLPIPRPDLLVIGTSLIGIILIISGACDLLIKKTREIEIEEKDERNIALANAAMADAFKVLSLLFAFALFALIFMGYLNEVSCFTFIGVFTVGQIVFVARLRSLHRKM